MTSKRILIVEDELLAARYLRKIIENLGHTVVGTATSAIQAIEMNALLQPTLILMDIALDGKDDGCDAAIEIKKHHTVSLIFLTAHSDEFTLEKANKCQPDGYILKPYNKEQIKVILSLDKTVPSAPDHTLCYLVDNYSFNSEKKTLFLNQAIEIEIGPKALVLIALLCKTPNISISNTQIMQTIYKKEVPIQTLRSLVHRIRQSTSLNLIKNVNSIGYKICTP